MLSLFQSKQPFVKLDCHHSLKYFHFGEENCFRLGKNVAYDLRELTFWCQNGLDWKKKMLNVWCSIKHPEEKQILDKFT